MQFFFWFETVKLFLQYTPCTHIGPRNNLSNIIQYNYFQSVFFAFTSAREVHNILQGSLQQVRLQLVFVFFFGAVDVGSPTPSVLDVRHLPSFREFPLCLFIIFCAVLVKSVVHEMPFSSAAKPPESIDNILPASNRPPKSMYKYGRSNKFDGVHAIQ